MAVRSTGDRRKNIESRMQSILKNATMAPCEGTGNIDYLIEADRRMVAVGTYCRSDAHTFDSLRYTYEEVQHKCMDIRNIDSDIADKLRKMSVPRTSVLQQLQGLALKRQELKKTKARLQNSPFNAFIVQFLAAALECPNLAPNNAALLKFIFTAPMPCLVSKEIATDVCQMVATRASPDDWNVFIASRLFTETEFFHFPANELHMREISSQIPGCTFATTQGWDVPVVVPVPLGDAAPDPVPDVDPVPELFPSELLDVHHMGDFSYSSLNGWDFPDLPLGPLDTTLEEAIALPVPILPKADEAAAAGPAVQFAFAFTGMMPDHSMVSSALPLGAASTTYDNMLANFTQFCSDFNISFEQPFTAVAPGCILLQLVARVAMRDAATAMDLVKRINAQLAAMPQSDFEARFGRDIDRRSLCVRLVAVTAASAAKPQTIGVAPQSSVEEQEDEEDGEGASDVDSDDEVEPSPEVKELRQDQECMRMLRCATRHDSPCNVEGLSVNARHKKLQAHTSIIAIDQAIAQIVLDILARKTISPRAAVAPGVTALRQLTIRRSAACYSLLGMSDDHGPRVDAAAQVVLTSPNGLAAAEALCEATFGFRLPCLTGPTLRPPAEAAACASPTTPGFARGASVGGASTPSKPGALTEITGTLASKVMPAPTTPDAAARSTSKADPQPTGIIRELFNYLRSAFQGPQSSRPFGAAMPPQPQLSPLKDTAAAAAAAEPRSPNPVARAEARPVSPSGNVDAVQLVEMPSGAVFEVFPATEQDWMQIIRKATNLQHADSIKLAQDLAAGGPQAQQAAKDFMKDLTDTSKKLLRYPEGVAQRVCTLGD